MDSWLADQEDCKPLCKYGRKCSKKNREHLEKYKHSPTKVIYVINSNYFNNNILKYVMFIG